MKNKRQSKYIRVPLREVFLHFPGIKPHLFDYNKYRHFNLTDCQNDKCLKLFGARGKRKCSRCNGRWR